MEYKSFWPGWETVRLIGRGSFGAVYEIQRKVFDDTEKAALKMITIPQNSSDIEEMHGDGYDDESITATFQSHLKSIVAEYSLMRKMSGCINIVNCDDVRYVQHDDKIGWDIFIKMELLTPLTKALPAQIPEDMVIKLGMDMCSALEMCSRYDIIHRDIKPQNIFVSPEGTYKLGDFGIAKAVEKTMGGTKIGTYKYMAPEVYNNKPYGTGADIYSLGLVLYWMLNERRMPFLPLPPAKLSTTAEDQARQRRFDGEMIPPPAHGNERLKSIVLKACDYDPKKRYKSAAEMMRDLNALVTPAEITVAKESVPMPQTSHSSHAGIAQKSKPQEVQSPKTDICIRFLNTDGTVIQSRTYSPGEYISAPNMVPEFEHEGFRYHFARWIPEVPATAIESVDCQVVYKKVRSISSSCSEAKPIKTDNTKTKSKESVVKSRETERQSNSPIAKTIKRKHLFLVACIIALTMIISIFLFQQLQDHTHRGQVVRPDPNARILVATWGGAVIDSSGNLWIWDDKNNHAVQTEITDAVALAGSYEKVFLLKKDGTITFICYDWGSNIFDTLDTAEVTIKAPKKIARICTSEEFLWVIDEEGYLYKYNLYTPYSKFEQIDNIEPVKEFWNSGRYTFVKTIAGDLYPYTDFGDTTAPFSEYDNIADFLKKLNIDSSVCDIYTFANLDEDGLAFAVVNSNQDVLIYDNEGILLAEVNDCTAVYPAKTAIYMVTSYGDLYACGSHASWAPLDDSTSIYSYNYHNGLYHASDIGLDIKLFNTSPWGVAFLTDDGRIRTWGQDDADSFVKRKSGEIFYLP